MAFRCMGLMVLGLTLASCSQDGIDGPRRHCSGVWLYEFEGSIFVEGATGIPAARPSHGESDWLEWADWPRLEGLMEERLENGDCYTVQPFLITFVGHRTHHPFGGAGHLGGWRSEVTVDRPISAERLGPSFCYGG